MRKVWEDVRSSLWFVPALFVTGAALLAIALIQADSHIGSETLARWPGLFGSSAEGARNILSAIAGSMITVAGVTFSITIVALSLTSNQYTPRILRNFMRDRSNQVVLGIFVSIFIYCLIVLRAIRGGEEAFVPSLSVLFAILFALASIAFLIYFIHHIATSIQASTIISVVAGETVDAILHLFPEVIGEAARENDSGEQERHPITGWKTIPSFATGYIQSVNPDALVRFAEENNSLVQMEKGIGEFVIKGAPLASISARGELKPDAWRSLNNYYIVNSYRTVAQDAGFGIRQIVDIALKALSPGINDTTTAMICVDYLGAILHCLVTRRIPARLRYSKGELRIIARGPTFESLVDGAFHEIRQSAKANVAVTLRMLHTIETVAAQARNGDRLQVLWRLVELINETSGKSIEFEHDRAALKECVARIARLMGQEALLNESPSPAKRND
jgi:uncharacterized membrane protein